MLLAGCATANTPPAVENCVLPGQQRMVVAQLFFGRAMRERGPQHDSEWGDFAAQIVTPNFPDGFTVFAGEGQWRNPRTGLITREPTTVLLVAAKPEADLGRRLSAVIEAYKRQFHQQSVGVITRTDCAAF